MKWVEKWFKPNDWHTVWIDKGHWTIHVITDFGKHDEYECSIYEIQVSEVRSKIRLKLSGYNPKKHDIYILAVRKFDELVKSCKNSLPK